MKKSCNCFFNLEGEIAVVTGGTGHLGYAMAEALSQHGALVVVAGRDQGKSKDVAAEIQDATKNRCLGVQLDVSLKPSIRKCFEMVNSEIGAFNILINNANFGERNDLEKMTEEQWCAGLNGTITNVFYCMQEALKHIRHSNHNNKSIINISSIYGMVSPNQEIYGETGYDNPSNYGAGKAAIIQLTKYAACHLAKENIRVNAISPGPFPKPIVQENKWFIDQLKMKVPLKRIGQPKEIKGATVFLASSASSYVTGHNLVVDGGWTSW